MYSEREAAEPAAGPGDLEPVVDPAGVVEAETDSGQAAKDQDPDPVWTADSTTTDLCACSSYSKGVPPVGLGSPLAWHATSSRLATLRLQLWPNCVRVGRGAGCPMRLVGPQLQMGNSPMESWGLLGFDRRR
jgi:hypothetical protein